MNDRAWRVSVFTQAIFTQGSWAGVRLMLGYRALEQGADPFFLGLVASGLALPGLLAALPLGRLADRFGGTRVVAVGIAITLLGAALVLGVPGLPVLLAGTVTLGLGAMCVMIGNQAFVARAAAAGSRDGAFGTLSAAASLGQMIAPAVITFAASLAHGGDAVRPDTSVGLIVCAAFSALAWPFSIVLRRMERALGPARRADGGAAAGSLLRIPGMWRALAVSGAVLVSVDLMFAFVPVWATENGIAAGTVGLLLSLRAAVSVVSRFGLSRLIARFGRRLLLIVAIVVAAVALGALPFLGVPGAVVVMIALGLGLGIPQPLTMTWVVALTDPARHGAALGLRMSANRLAQLCLPLAITSIAGGFGVAAVFLANAVLLGGAVALTVHSNADGNR